MGNGNGGTSGFVHNGEGMGREREGMLEVVDVARGEGTEIGLVGVRESCGELYDEASTGGISSSSSS